MIIILDSPSEKRNADPNGRVLAEMLTYLHCVSDVKTKYRKKKGKAKYKNEVEAASRLPYALPCILPRNRSKMYREQSRLTTNPQSNGATIAACGAYALAGCTDCTFVSSSCRLNTLPLWVWCWVANIAS